MPETIAVYNPLRIETRLDLEALLEHPFFVFDILFLLFDIECFIGFSETWIRSQKPMALLHAEHEVNEGDASDFFDAVEGVEYRFDVMLTQRVRYAALTALITTLDWVVLQLSNQVSFEFPRRPEKTNEAIHTLAVLASKASLDLSREIQLFEKLVRIRNSVVHAGGLLTSYKHKVQIQEYLDELPGLKHSNINMLDESSVMIEPNFLEGLISEMRLWLPSLVKALAQQGLMRRRDGQA